MFQGSHIPDVQYLGLDNACRHGFDAMRATMAGLTSGAAQVSKGVTLKHYFVFCYLQRLGYTVRR